MVRCGKKRHNIREINFEVNHNAWLTKNLPTALGYSEITEILSTVFQNKMFSDLHDPVTDVSFVPMQIKPLILSFSLGFGHEAGEKPKL